MKLSAAAIALLTMSTTVNGKDLCFASVDLVVKFFLTFYIKIPQRDYTPMNRNRIR